MKKYVIALSLLVMFVLTAFIGCGTSDDPTIADVEGYKITTSEFNDFFSRIRLTYPTAQDEYNNRREMLDTMIVTRLLIQGAYELNIDKLDEIDRVILANKDKFLLDALYQNFISDKAAATEVEMKSFYNHLENKIRASHILISDPDTAQMIFDRIQQGENFEQLAFDYSIDPQAKRNKGDLGYFVWGSMIDTFQETVFAMESGEISPPFKTRYGYHIVKVVDKLPNENRTTYEIMKETIKSKVTQRNVLNLTETYFNSVREKYPVHIDTSTCEYILHKREQMYPPQVLKTLPRNDFDRDQLDRDEKELIFATIQNGGQMTLNEYLTQLQNVPMQFRPNLDDYDSLETVVFELKKMEILAIEAVREGLDNEENYIAQLKLFKELNMAEVMRYDSIHVPSPPDEGMARQYYDDNPEEFTNPAQVHVYEILLSDELKARKLQKEIRSLKEFKEKAMDITERAGKRSKNGDLGYITRQWFPEIFDLAIKTSIGEIAGPVVSSRRYSIFYVVDKIEPELKDYLGQKRGIIQKLTAQQRDIAFNQWISERLQSTNVEIDEDALWASINMEKYVTADSLNH